jgi:hypothetical protein
MDVSPATQYSDPDKFQFLAVGRKIYDKNPPIHIQNFDLTCESTEKLLGIDIDYQLNFDAHISTICRKASQQLSILKRLGEFLSTFTCKIKILNMNGWIFVINFSAYSQKLKFVWISLHFIYSEPFH